MTLLVYCHCHLKKILEYYTILLKLNFSLLHIQGGLDKMITDVEVSDDALTWQSDGYNYQAALCKGTYIYDNDHILLMDEGRSKVVALNEKGQIIKELENSNELFLMYLQKHLRFGLTVVASLKDREDGWKDYYLALKSNKFEKASKAR